MKLRCPVCHSSNSLETYTEDAAQHELLALLGKNVAIFWPLVSYLGMFRSANRDLANSRALKLANEVLSIGVDSRQLATALSETVESLRRKRDEGKIEPLTGHRYLIKVLASVASLPPSSAPTGPLLPQGEGLQGSPLPEDPLGPKGEGGQRPGEGGRLAPKGKRAQALDELDNWGAGA